MADVMIIMGSYLIGAACMAAVVPFAKWLFKTDRREMKW